MRVGIVFHKNPYLPPTGIDLVRLRAIAGGLLERGISTEIVAPVPHAGCIEGKIPVRPLSVLDVPDCYDIVKTCYHPSIMLIGRFGGPVVSRIVRVVDHQSPARDEPFREQLLRCQKLISERSAVLVLNNRANEERWRDQYGPKPDIKLIPTGCPRHLPELGPNPFPSGQPVILFLGSIAAPRMIRLLNEAAYALEGIARIHFVGRNKAYLYGGDAECTLSSLITDHGEIPETNIWDYVRHASVGLALATGPDPFDNDVSKIMNYLRGGLPVLSEAPILTNELIRKTGLGRIFQYNDVSDLVLGVQELLQLPRDALRKATMEFMSSQHSWDRRVEAYMDVFSLLVKGKRRK